MRVVQASDFVESEFPSQYQRLIPPSLKVAYDAVDALYATEPLFGVESAAIGKGHVIAWAVDRQIEKLVETNQLPFDRRWVPFEKPTGKFLQLRLPASTLSINQLPFAQAIPRRAQFRHNRILNNQPCFDLPEFEEERKITGLPHLILSHGYHKLEFANIGILSPRPHREGWIYRTPNLLNIPHIVASDLAPVEGADVEADVSLKELKEEIIRWVHDNGEK
jgi:hypothetical protein